MYKNIMHVCVLAISTFYKIETKTFTLIWYERPKKGNWVMLYKCLILCQLQ